MLPIDLPRLWDWLTSQQLVAALLSAPDSLSYLSGYANPTDTSLPFQGCPLLALIVAHEAPSVVVPCTEEADFRQASWLTDVWTYANYDWQQPVQLQAAACEAASRLLQRFELTRGTIGLEKFHLPAAIEEGLRDRYPHLRWNDITGRLADLRAIKTPAELAAIQRAAQLSDVGQARVRSLIEPGASEIAIFSEARAAMEQAAGQRIRVAGDLVTGQRSGADGGGLPRDTRLRPGDLVISDIVPRLNGWWADSCATLAVGEPSSEQRRLHQLVAEALEVGRAAARPGVRASQVDTLVRGYLARHGYHYPHHTGHGVGVAQAEAPWIVPYNHTVLQANMVIALEPGIYPGGSGGVRLEDLFVVTTDGLQLLTHHDRQL